MRKTTLAVSIAALLSGGIHSNLWAESSPMESKMPGHSSTMHDRKGEANMDNLAPVRKNNRDILPENYLKKEVITSNGESIGKIDKLMINKADNSVYAISGVGGFWGMGEKTVAIPVNKLRKQGDKLVLASGVTEESLKQDKQYEKSEFSAFEVKSISSDY